MATTDIDVRELEQRGIDVIRGLAMDAVQKANSGHPGTPMALAPLAHVLFTRIMRYDAATPDWPDRDRFVLSNGHASMLLYSMLYLTGFGLDARRPRAVPPVGLEDRRATPSTATPPASRSPPVRSARASPTAVGIGARRGEPARAVRRRRSSTTTSSCSAATATSRRASATRRRRSPATSGSAASSTSTTTTTSPSTAPPSSRTPTTCPSASRRYGWHVVAARRGRQRPRRARGAGSARAWPRPSRPSSSCCAATSGTRRPSTPTPPRRTATRSAPTRSRAVKEILGLPAERLLLPDDVLEYYRDAGTPRSRGRARSGSSAAPRSATREPELAAQLRRVPSSSAASPGGRRSSRRGRRARSSPPAQACAQGRSTRSLDVVPGLVGGGADLTGNTGTALEDAPVIATHRLRRPPASTSASASTAWARS